MDQCIDPSQGTGKVALGDIVDSHYLNVASVNLGEILLIRRVFRGAYSAVKDPRLRIYSQVAGKCLPPDVVTLFDQLINDMGSQEPGDTSNLQTVE